MDVLDSARTVTVASEERLEYFNPWWLWLMTNVGVVLSSRRYEV